MDYCVLLDHLYRSGINGKCWIIINSFYDAPTARVNKNLTKPFILQRGVYQGSILSPMLVIDSLLRDLQTADAGLSIYTGSLGRADDLRCFVPSLTCGNKQTRIAEASTVEYSLKLNLDKLETLPMYEGSNISPGNEQLLEGSLSITPSTSSKCLGVMWSSNLSPKVSIDLNIKKARGAFFALGSMGIH